MVVRKSRTTTIHGAIKGKIQQKKIILYNLDVIISVDIELSAYNGTGGIIYAENAESDLVIY